MGNKTLLNLNLQNLYLQSKNIKIQHNINDKPRQVKQYHYSRSQPKIRNSPKLVGLSKNIIQELNLDYQDIKINQNTPKYLSGSLLLPNSEPICNNYCGFQFGVWAGQLGDGRAHTLGHLKNNNKIYEIQLKGSGKTPYSRHADGNSVVSSALRQFLASQLLFGLKIPTTRAASLVVAQQQVIRDPLYNGNIKIQNAAVVLRICQSFLRFGSVQVCLQQANMVKQNPLQNRKTLLPLFDYLLQHCYPQIDHDNGDPYEAIYKILVQKSAQLVAYWQSIGFVHGVLNTDNMSLIGLTIDYGPFAFIDYFSKDYISNATDQHERYSYRRQPQVIKWNLNKLAEAMDSIVPNKILKRFLQENFDKFYQQKYQILMCEKLGISVNDQNSKNIIQQLFETMNNCSSHFTNIFRILEKNFKKQNNQISKQQLLKQLLQQSCGIQYFLKNIRVFPNLIGRSYEQILKYDDGFNINFLNQQQKRSQLFWTLRKQNCKQRYERQKLIWQKWIDKYLKMKPKIKQNSSPKYVLLNEIAKKINSQLLQIQNSKDQIQYLQKILNVFYNPYEYNQWFQEKFWKYKPTPVKLTCSS